MSDGNETDASGQQPEVSAALRAQIDDIADTINVVARALSDLDRRSQLAQAATTAADQRWEQRITTMESHLAELDAALRSESEQVRGSTSVLELLSHEIRSSLAQNSVVGELAANLQESLDTLRADNPAAELSALRDRLDDFDLGFSTIAASVSALETALTDLGEQQVDPDAVLGAIEGLADRQPDLAPLLTAIAEIPASLPDLNGLRDSLESRENDLVPIHHELLALRITQPDVTPVLDALQDLRDRQVDLTPVHDELRELRGSQPDLSPVIDALDGLAASLPTQFRELEGRLPIVDVSSFAASLDQLAEQQTDLRPILDQLETLRAELTELRTNTATAQPPADLDLSPVIDALDRQQTASDDSIRELRSVEDWLAPITDAFETMSQDIAAQSGELISLRESRHALERALSENVGDIDRAVAARQLEHQTELARLISSIPDPTEAVDALGLSLAGRVAGRDSETSSDLVARLDALADRTDTSLQAVRDSIEERLSTLDESRSADAAVIRDAIEHVDSQERLVADSVQSIAEQIAATSADSDALWLRATELLTGVDRVTGEHAAALGAVAEAQEQLVERDAADREGLSAVTRELAELRGRTEAVDLALTSLTQPPDQTAAVAGLRQTIEPLSAAMDALTELAGEHRARLDTVGRSVEAFGEVGPRFEEAQSSLEHRIEALLDRQADLQASVRDLHPRLDSIDEHHQSDSINELLTRFSATGADLEVVGPRLEQLLTTLERTEQRVSAQEVTLDRVDARSEQLEDAVGLLTQSAERLEVIDTLAHEITSLSSALAEVDAPSITERLDALSGRVDDVRTEVGTGASGILDRIDLAASASNDRLTRLDEQSADDRGRTGEQLSSLATSAAEVARELDALHGNLTTRHDDVQQQLDTIQSRSEGIAETSQHLAAADAGRGAAMEALVDRLDLLERVSTEADQTLSREVGQIRSGIAEQFAALAEPVNAITGHVAAMDFTALSTQLEDSANQQQRTSRDVTAAVAASSEINDFLRDAISDLSGRIGAIDLEAVRVRLQWLEDEQRASEQRLASSLSSVHAVVDAFELEPVLGRLETLEIQSGESERGLHAAIADVRTAALSIDLGPVDHRISDLEHRSRTASDELSHKISEVVDQLARLDLSELGASLSTLETNTVEQRDQVSDAVDALAAGLDLDGFGARLDALGQQANQSAALESEIRTAVRGLTEQLGDLDLQPISVRLDQLVDAVHATDEASRTSLAGEIEAMSRHISELDTERVNSRLHDLAGAQDRLAATMETELAATVDSVQSVVAVENETTQAIREEMEQLRETVVDQFSSATVEQRQGLIDRIDTLGNTVVDRLDDTRTQTDSLAAQVTSIHAALATTGTTGGDIRAHVDGALEGLAERIGGALRDLRREVTDLGSANDTSGMRTTFETGLDRLSQRFDADIARVVELLSSSDDTDRLRRIDSSITEIRRDFEMLRRISDQALSTTPD